MAQKKYLVTGACGLTGSHIVDVLLEQGKEVIATDLPTASRRYLSRKAKFVPADITDREQVERLVEGVDVILHPAGIFNFSAPYPLLRKVNVEGTKNLCEAALHRVSRLVSWSTCGVYGKVRKNARPIREDYPPNPIEDYSQSKHEQDQVVLSYHKKGLDVSIVRPGVVYGPRCKYGMGKVLLTLARAPVVPLVLNFTFQMSPVHVRDVARAGVFLAEKEEAIGEVFHVVDCSKATMRDVLKIVAKLRKKPTVPLFVPYGLAASMGRLAAEVDTFVSQRLLHRQPLLEVAPMRYFPMSLDVSNEKLLSLGFELEFPEFEEGAKNTLDWYSKEGWI